MATQPAADEAYLLSFLRQGGEQQALSLASQLTPEDWQAAAQQAARHELSAYFFQRLRELGVDDRLPQALHERLSSAYHHNAGRNILLARELGDLLAACEQAGIQVIPLKGAYLAEAVYGNLAGRRMHDLDLLIPLADLPRAAQLLDGLGYHPERPYRLDEELAIQQHLPPYSRPGGPLVELHGALLPPGTPFTLHPEGLWERSRPARLAGQTCRLPAPEDLLLHLIFHASYQHAFGLGLSPLLDISLVMVHFQAELDWQAFTQRALEGGLGRCAFLTLQAVAGLLHAPIPPACWRRCSRRTCRRLTRGWCRSTSWRARAA